MNEGTPRKSKGIGWTIASIIGFVIISTVLRTCHQQQTTNQEISRTDVPHSSYSYQAQQPASSESTPSTSPLPTPELALLPPPSPKSRALPKSEFKQLELAFTSLGPPAHGTLRNNTEWFITGGSIIVTRQYVQIVENVLEVDPPPADECRFDLKILNGIIPPFTTAEIEVDIGHYLDTFQITRGNLPVRFHATAKARIDSMRGYPQ